MADLARLSLNQMTVANWSAEQAIEGCVRHGIPSIGLWRHKIEEAGLPACIRKVKEAGLRVSSVCWGGMFPAPTEAERKQKIEDNYRAVEEATALEADCLVLVVGGSAGIGLTDARKMVADGLAALVPYAKEHNVKLGLEPLHPMYAADRSVLVTIGHALELASLYQPHEVGLILDAFHIWWDPQVDTLIAQCRARIYGFHVSDWLAPLPDVLMGRGMMGDGVIDNRSLRLAVDRAGYNGPIEVEIFNRSLWDADPDTVLQQMVDRFTALV